MTLVPSLAELAVAAGLRLPEPPEPGGRYRSFVRSANQLWVAGQLPRVGDEVQHRGIVGANVSVAEAREAAVLCALNTLGVVSRACDGDAGELRLISVTGFVRCTADFSEQAKVVDGASEVFLRVLGDRGPHVRTSVGANALPRGAPVEIATVWEVSSRG
jgi:enamine deaminase RidA (YjgF/YER057c/UK114 family)